MSTIDVGQVAMIPLEQIEVTDRARVEMGDLDEFEAALKEQGLAQPLAVYHQPNQPKPYRLVAGGRRYAVLAKNQVPEVPVRIFEKELSPLEIKILELSENINRKDFEWLERANLEREIHNLQLELHGGKKLSTSADAQGWSLRDTARFVDRSVASVHNSVQLADAAEKFPELFTKCKNQSDATKILKKLGDAAVREQLVKKFELQTPKSSTDAVRKKLSDNYIVRDFFEGVRAIPDETFHLVEIDPPYAIKLESTKKDYSYDGYNEVPADDYQNFLAKTFAECYRVMTKHSWLICWFAPEPWFEAVYRELCNAGFETTRLCGIWTKHQGQSMRPETHLANSYEMFFYAWKGRPALARPGMTNEFDVPPVPAQKKRHPTERPVELMQQIYTTFTWPNSRILIPFLGSGNGILAAHRSNMTALGFDLTKAYKDSFIVELHKNFVQ